MLAHHGLIGKQLDPRPSQINLQGLGRLSSHSPSPPIKDLIQAPASLPPPQPNGRSAASSSANAVRWHLQLSTYKPPSIASRYQNTVLMPHIKVKA